jgi:hypothetical protein
MDKLLSFSHRGRMNDAVSFVLAQKAEYTFSVIYCIKKLVELVKYLTKKSKISH